ncbi:oxygen-independent coproporphyrinogen III oxidase [Pantoea eucrina]|uniref:oxygen-independent coproporphyrinogen III oxidase n=1 Tax=Pantoea eucrina TaxID=472693 RepID=UPI003CE98427
MTAQQIEWDQQLVEKYSGSGPRYTSYPTAPEFSETFRAADFEQAATRYPHRPLSLYVHIPFCHKLCYFCGCNKIVTRQRQKADRYLNALAQEIACRAPLFAGRRVTQLHWGGGTPTFLDGAQISRLMALLRHHFAITDDAEMSIEIDPREIAPATIDHLRTEGFNRLSIGIQDFDRAVQARINRIQDEAAIGALVKRAREQGFRSVSFDLIYGLPLQSAERFALTLQRVIALAPDRLSLFSYAHMPALFAAQRKIKAADLPDGAQKLLILQQSIATLTAAGYRFIGMDHFARPDDGLAIAQRSGLLHRNFQGYTTHGESDLLGLGVSAISMLGDSYAQNRKALNEWYAGVEQQGSALWRGLTLTEDDRLRREVIKQLICNFTLDFAAVEAQWPIVFEDYFADDLAQLAPLVAEGLVCYERRRITATGRGRLLIRSVCMCFDRYLRQKSRQQHYSRII